MRPDKLIKRIEECRAKARRCCELADVAWTPRERARYVELFKMWERFAAELEHAPDCALEQGERHSPERLR